MDAFYERIIGKTLSYRIGSSLITVLIVYAFFGEFQLSVAIGGIDFLIKMVWYYVHEDIWAHFDWGKLRKKSK